MTHPSVHTAQPALPPTVPPPNHGHTVAAWFAMIGIMVGTGIGSYGVVMSENIALWGGSAIALIGMIGGGVLRRMGYGQSSLGS